MKLSKFTFLILFNFAISGCGKNIKNESSVEVITANIVGGTEVVTSNIYSRHTVGLRNKNKNTICTGVIIENDLILTAAHCVSGVAAKKLEVIFGNKLSGRDSVKIKVRAQYAHLQYNVKPVLNDIALIRLEENIPSNFSPVDLEDSRQLILEMRTQLTMIGYGVNRLKPFKSGEGVLRIANAFVNDYASAGRLISLDQRLGSGGCFGDSGGPAFALINERPVLVGVLSFVSSNVNDKNPCLYLSYYSTINYFYSWIQDSKIKI